LEEFYRYNGNKRKRGKLSKHKTENFLPTMTKLK
jgi:hypothetical protein